MSLFLLVPALFYLSLIGLLFIKQRSIIFQPDTSPLDLSAVQAQGILVNEISVKTEDGLNLKGWFFPPSREDGKIILFFQGNAGNISHRLFKIKHYLDAGYGVVLAGYRGYGKNPGQPSEQGLYTDGLAYVDWLSQKGILPSTLILYGESLGTGVAVELAAQSTYAGVILETPYARFSDAARLHYPYILLIDLLLKDRFDSASKIGRVTAPLLFLVAGQDETLGAETALALYEAASQPKSIKIFKKARHNSLYDFGVEQDILSFLGNLPATER